MSEPESFVSVAPYYDELMKSVPYPMWVSYYLLLLAHQSAHPRTILDVCCGTGTMCELLTREGFQMEGFDLSAEMIRQARIKARRKKLAINYHVANAAAFNLGKKFDAAFSYFDSLNNIVDPSMLQQAFVHVNRHLHPNGSWIFDLNTSYAFEAEMFNQKNLRANARLRYDWVGTWDPETKRIQVDMDFWRRGDHFKEVHHQRAYEAEEVREMLLNAGFDNIRVFHSYTLNPPRARSDRLHYSAIKVEDV